jgi:hypothetical protein
MIKCVCGHPCHCKGKGKYLNSATCIGYGCDCTNCLHVTINVEDTMSWVKKQWQKFIDWFFKGFYK